MGTNREDDLLADLEAVSGTAPGATPATPPDAPRNREERRGAAKAARRSGGSRRRGSRDSRPPEREEAGDDEGDATSDDAPLREEDEDDGHAHDHADAPREEVSLTDLERAVAVPAPPGPDAPPAPPADPVPPLLPPQQPATAVVPEGKKACPYCAELTDKGANFCTECGQQQPKDGSPASAVQPAPQASVSAASAPIPPTVWTAPPPSPVAPAVPVSQVLWFLAGPDRKAIGPFDWDEMAAKGLQADTQVHRANGTGWITAGADSLLKPLIKPAPQQVPQAPPPPPAPAAVNTPGFNPFAPPQQPAPAAHDPNTCPKCSAKKVAPTDKFCRSCRTPFPTAHDPAQQPPQQPAPAAHDPNTCPKCSAKKVAPTDKFCRSCRTPFPTS